MTTYLIMTVGHHPIEHFTDLEEARNFIEGTTHYIKYVPEPGAQLDEPSVAEEFDHA